MTKLVIEFDLENDAFMGGNGANEVFRILNAVGRKIKEGQSSGKVMDSNGNSIGSYQFVNLRKHKSLLVSP